MNKLIVENRTDKSLGQALKYVSAVVSQGRISNRGKQHCYHTVFNDGTTVTSFLNEKSERLVVAETSQNAKEVHTNSREK